MELEIDSKEYVQELMQKVNVNKPPPVTKVPEVISIKNMEPALPATTTVRRNKIDQLQRMLNFEVDEL